MGLPQYLGPYIMRTLKEWLGSDVAAGDAVQLCQIVDSEGKIRVVFWQEHAPHFQGTPIKRLRLSEVARLNIQSSQVIENLGVKGMIFSGSRALNLQRLAIKRFGRRIVSHVEVQQR